MHFVITDWHRKNPNVWVALEMTEKRNPNEFILRGRDKTLLKLHDTMRELDFDDKVYYCKAWMVGIGKDWKIDESRTDYYKRKGFPQCPE